MNFDNYLGSGSPFSLLMLRQEEYHKKYSKNSQYNQH